MEHFLVIVIATLLVVINFITTATAVERCVKCQFHEVWTGNPDKDKEFETSLGSSNPDCSTQPAQVQDTEDCNICMAMDMWFNVNLEIDQPTPGPVNMSVHQVVRGCTGYSNVNDVQLTCITDTEAVKAIVDDILDAESKVEMKKFSGSVCHCVGERCNIQVPEADGTMKAGSPHLQAISYIVLFTTTTIALLG